MLAGNAGLQSRSWLMSESLIIRLRQDISKLGRLEDSWHLYDAFMNSRI